MKRIQVVRNRACGRFHGSTALRSCVRRFHVYLNAMKFLRMCDGPGAARAPPAAARPGRDTPGARLVLDFAFGD